MHQTCASDNNIWQHDKAPSEDQDLNSHICEDNEQDETLVALVDTFDKATTRVAGALQPGHEKAWHTNNAYVLHARQPATDMP